MKRFLFGIIFLSVCSFAFGQEVERDIVTSSGDFYSNSVGQLSSTLGEPVIASHANNSNQLTQGFQQTKITTVGLLDFAEDFEVSIFPNPSDEFFLVQIPELSEDLELFIYTVEGKLMLENTLTLQETKIKVFDWAQGVYLLSLHRNNELIKTFKIEKN